MSKILMTSSQTPKDGHSDAEENLYADLPPRQTWMLLLSIMVIALCGIVYELIIGTISSYLMGNSVYQFSLTIGFFMFAMGIGSYLSKFIDGNLVRNFIYVEIILALVGGICSLALFYAFPFVPGLYQTIMFGFIFLIGTLVGLEIPLLTRILAQALGTKHSIANVMSLDYVGALLGSIAFPLLLLPGLGLIRSSFAIGLVNILVAFVTLLFLRDYIPGAKRLFALVGGAFLLLLGLVFTSDYLTSIARSHLYFDKVIWQKQTPYQHLVVTQDWYKKDLRLFIDGHVQFSQTDEHRYHEALVHPLMSLPSKAENILVMGGGDGLAVRELLKYPSIKHIDLVDLDPAMTHMGKTFPPLVKLNKNALSDPRVHIYNEDAFVFIRRKGRMYDRVFLDFPDPHNEAISKLYSSEFYAMLSQRMPQKSGLVTQSSSPFFARRTFWTIAETLKSTFPATISYQVTVPAFGLWGYNIALKESGTFPGPLKVPTRYLSDEVFKASLVFGKDVANPGGMTANSIFEPNLYQRYIKDMNSSNKIHEKQS